MKITFLFAPTLLCATCWAGLPAALGAPAESSAAATCRAASGDTTTALVELYTSEGCDSCPPADRWLSQLDGARDRAMAGRSFVAVAYHVDYWDRLGWKDRFGSADFAARQNEQTRRQQAAFVYTPQVSIQGRDYRDWQSADRLQRSFQTINEAPARARISLQVMSPTNGGAAADVGVAVDAQVEPGYPGDAVLTVALTQNGLASEVAAGENAGKRLAHDHVVRAWQPGLALSSGKLHKDVRFTLPADRGPLSVVAFVEDLRSGEVLQALDLGLCDGRVSQASAKP
jgi:hypothetical protein